MAQKQKVGSLYLEVFLDPNKYYQQLADCEKRTREIAERIDRQMRARPLRPKVDETELDRLNKHYDIKIQHHDKVRSHFRNNPIKVFVDDSELKKLAVGNRTINVDVIYRTKGIDVKDKRIKVDVDGRSVGESLGKELEKAGERVAKGIRKSVKKGAFGSLFDGVFAGIGEEVGRQFSRASGIGGYGKSAGQHVKRSTSAADSRTQQDAERELQKEIDKLRSQINEYKKSKANKNKVNIPIKISDLEKVPIEVERVQEQVKHASKSINQDLGRMVAKSIDSLKKEVKRAVSVESADKNIGNIKGGFSTAYAALSKSLEEGNLKLAKAQAEIIVDNAERARKEIDAIKNDLEQGQSSKFGSAIATKIGSAKGVIRARYENPAKRALNQVKKQQDFINIGNDVLQGVSTGLKDTSQVRSQASQIALAILNQMRTDLGIKSPSRKAIAIMQQYIQGLVVGARDGAAKVKKSVEPIGEAMVAGVSNAANSRGGKWMAGQIFTPTRSGRVPGMPKSPREAREYLRNAGRYARIFERNARTMPEGSAETSHERVFNRVTPPKVKKVSKERFAAAAEGIREEIEALPDLLHHPLIKKLLTYQIKFDVKGWTDVTDLIYKDVNQLFGWLEGKAGSSKYFGEFLQNSTGGMKNLSLTAVAAANAFFRFFSMFKYLGYLTALNAAVAITVTLFESLERRFSLTARSAAQAQVSLQRIAQTRKALALDGQVALEGAAVINTAMRNRINNQQSIDNINNSALLAARIYGVNPQEQQQILAGFGGLAQDATLSEMSFGALQDSVPDIYAIGARTAGTSEQGFRQGLREGAYSSADFLPALAQQLESELSPKTAEAMDTISVANQRLANSFIDLQLSFTNFVAPFNKFTTNAFAAAIEMAAGGTQLFANALNGLAFFGVIKFSQSLIRLASNLLVVAKGIPFLSTALLAFTRIVQHIAGSVLPIFSKMLKELLIFQLAVDVITVVTTAFSDLSGQIGKSADHIEKSLSRFNKLLKETRESAESFAKELPKSFNEVNGKSYLEDTFFGGIIPSDWARGIEKFAVGLDQVVGGVLKKVGLKVFDDWQTRSEKEVTDRGTQVDKIVANSQETQTAINDQLFTPGSELKRLSEYDKKIESIQRKRNALAVADPTNRREFERLRREEEITIRESNKLRRPVEALSGTQASVVKSLSDALDEYDRLASERLITQEEYTKRTEQIKTALDQAEKSQEAFNKQLRNSITPIQAFERAWEKIAGILESTKTQLTLIANQSRTAIAQAEIGNTITPGQATFAREEVNINNLRGQVAAQRDFISQGRAELNSKGGRETFAELGINQKTSASEVRSLAKHSEGFPLQEKLLERLAEVKDAELNLSELETQLVEAQSQLQKNLINLTKQVDSYYRGISRNAQQQAIELERAIAQINVTQQQNELRTALLDGYDTIVSQFVDSIIDSISQFNQVGDRQLEAQSQLLQNNFQLEDTLRQGVDLSRELPTVPIELDFSSIPSDNNIAELKNQIDDAISGSDSLGDSINNSTDNAEILHEQLTKNIKPIEGVNEAVAFTRTKIDDVTRAARETNNQLTEADKKSTQWKESLNNVPEAIEKADTGLGGILSKLQGITSQTGEWLAALGQVASGGGTKLLEGMGSLGNLASDLVSGSGNGSLIEPVDRKKYRITSGYGWRTIFGRRDFHEGLDYGTPTGTSVKAPVSGFVTHAGHLGGGAGTTVKIAGKDAQGRKTEDMLLHLSRVLVKVGDYVKQGQVVAKSGATGRGTGAHLDWRRKVDGKWENPEVSLRKARNAKPVPTQTSVSSSGIRRGGNLLSQAEAAKLTPLGRQLYQYQQNPNVLAFSDVVARAEGTDFRRNSKNFGYGMLIGGSNTTNFATHPFVDNSGRRTRSPIANSTASGRYQMMDFNYAGNQAARQFGRGAKSDLSKIFQGNTPGSFSPAVQDLYFIASLKQRGVLDEVLKGDFAGALKNTSIAKHYASLQAGNKRSYYGGQGTPQGQLKSTIPFAQQRALARRNEQRPVSLAANRHESATPEAMRMGVGRGMQLATTNAANQQALIQQQAEADITRARQEATRRANQAIAQYERGRREQADQLVSRRRELTDFGIDANKNQSPKDRARQESTQLQRRIQDLVRDRERELENRRKQVEQAQQALSSGALNNVPLTEEISSQLKAGLQENQVAISELEKQIPEIRRIGKEYEQEITRTFNREEKLRKQQVDFDIDAGEIAKLQKRLEALQARRQAGEFTPELFDIPKLQEQIELKQADLDLDRAIASERDKLFKHSTTQQESERRIEQLKQENILRQENAIARRKQAEAEQELQKAQRELEVKSEMSGFNSEYLQNLLQLRQLGKGGRSPLDIQREITTGEFETSFAQREFEIKNNRNRTPEERERSLQSLKDIRSARQRVIDAELARTKEDNSIAARDLFNESNLSVTSAQASRFRTFGQDNRARELEKGMAIYRQNLDLQDKLRELERLAQVNEEVAQSADLIRANYEELNQIKLDEINNQFNEFLPAIAQVKDATQGLFTDLLSGADDTFANFGKKILDYFTQLAAQMLTNDLFGAIGGAFGQKAPQAGGGGGDLFNLLGSVLGGLFYSGGYVPNYAGGYNPLSAALSKEHAQTGRKPYVAVLSEGERVLNLDETRKFHSMGGDSLLQMASGGYVGAKPNLTSSIGSSNVSVSNNITINSSGGESDVGEFRSILDGRIREVIKQEQRPGRSLNRKRR